MVSNQFPQMFLYKNVFQLNCNIIEWGGSLLTNILKMF